MNANTITGLLVILVVNVAAWSPLLYFRLGDIATQLKRIADSKK